MRIMVMTESKYSCWQMLSWDEPKELEIWFPWDEQTSISEMHLARSKFIHIV